MAKGQKTGGRQKGTPNKPNPLKDALRSLSTAYFEQNILVDDADLADKLNVNVGDYVSHFDADMAAMEPKDRAAIQEKLLRYHTPQMQSVSAELSVEAEITSIESQLAQLATDND
jgi:hypothetical protein